MTTFVVHRPLEQAPRVLTENRRHYERLVEVVRHYAGQGDVEHVLRATMLAANFAWRAPVGLLSDLRLERAVVHAVRGSGTVTVEAGRTGGRVLHVLSEAYSIGGHTRLVWRWMSRDERTSDVVLTNQNGPVPDRLVESVRASGGELHDLRATTADLLDRARVLRSHMDRADLVVLHVHPYDAVALAAVNLPGARPPVLYENHADHAFWLGVAGADLLCDLRDSSRLLDVPLRGVPEERIGVLPMPIEKLTSTDGGELRHRLGIRPDAVVAVTVSADWKMHACWGRGMHHVVDRVLHWCPQLVVVLVGATPNADWARLAKRYPGRVFPVGSVPDPAPYFDLADIYLESYPTRAGTSPLEAAVLGLPVVGLAEVPEDEPAYVLQSCSPGLASRPVATTADQLALAVRRLAADPELRRQEGDEVRDAVLALHDGPGWRAHLEAVYALARSLPAVDVDALGESPTDDRYGALLLSATGRLTSPDSRELAGPLGPQLDERLMFDLFAVENRDEGSSLSVRIGAGWEDRPDWAQRLLGLAARHPRLSVSLPLAAGDDPAGSRSVAAVTALLARNGNTTDDCGDVRLDPARPVFRGPCVGGELPLTEQALDRLEGLVSSPLWEDRAAVPVGA